MPRPMSTSFTSSPPRKNQPTKQRMSPLPPSPNHPSKVSTYVEVSKNNSITGEVFNLEDPTTIMDVVKRLANLSKNISQDDFVKSKTHMRLCAVVAQFAKNLVIDHGAIPDVYHSLTQHDPISPADDKFHYINLCANGHPADNNDKVVCAISFPIHRYEQNQATIWFNSPVTKWKALKAVEEYFNQPCSDDDWKLGRIDLKSDIIRPDKRHELLRDAIYLHAIHPVPNKYGHFSLVIGS